MTAQPNWALVHRHWSGLVAQLLMREFPAERSAFFAARRDSVDVMLSVATLIDDDGRAGGHRARAMTALRDLYHALAEYHDARAAMAAAISPAAKDQGSCS